jgi:O-antigen/teichoic acid export membrane protein
VRSALLKRIIDLGRGFHFGTSAALIVSAALQALTFVLLARGLGADGFGRLMIMQAFSQLALELVSFGAGEALIRRVARDHRQHAAALGHALVMTSLTAIVLAGILSPIVHLNQRSITFAAVGTYMFGELFGNRLINLAEHAFIGHFMVSFANSVRIISSAIKLCAVVIGMYELGFNDLESWVYVQSVTTIFAGFTCLTLLVVRLGMPIPAFHRADLGFGVLMCTTQFARAVQFSVDRIVLGMVTSPSVVAAYSAGIRGIQVALIPIMAILRNLFSQFFKRGQGGLAETRQFALANLPKVVIMGLLTGGLLITGSNVFAAILGRGFAETAPILRWLSLVALLQGIQYLLADALTGADRQIWRTASTVVGTAGYVGLVAILALYYGVRGAVAAIYLYQLLMIATYVLLLNLLASREANLRPPVPLSE